ncbi:MAG: hypothetical protein K6D90_07065 [Lachnospiraceae bacterium]|nr:hypothetical protein [Lachnospiraceae bacterium]
MSSEKDNTDQMLDEMTEALQEAIEVQEKYSKVLEELEQENELLTNVIIKYKLGREVEKERRTGGEIDEKFIRLLIGDIGLHLDDEQGSDDLLEKPDRIPLDERIDHAKRQL